MDRAERERREAVFAGAGAAVLGCRPVMATGIYVEAQEPEGYRLCSPDNVAGYALGHYEGEFMSRIDGHRTVGEIIELMATKVERNMAEVIAAGKDAMAALHVHYVDGVIGELRGLRAEG